jgi:hypothetical protein
LCVLLLINFLQINVFTNLPLWARLCPELERHEGLPLPDARLAHLFNTLARFARHLKALYAQLGVRPTIAFIRQSCAAPWLDPERMRALLSEPFQLQLE